MSKSGFTLIELMVVITIMAIVGTFAIANYRSFGEDQDLKSASLDIQSLLRTAQTNATTNLKCNSSTPAKEWRVVFSNNKTTMDLKCFDGSSEYTAKTLPLNNNIKIDDIISLRQIGLGLPCIFPIIFAFTSLSGVFSNDCDSQQDMQIIIINTKINSIKTITVETGGRVYVQ